MSAMYRTTGAQPALRALLRNPRARTASTTAAALFARRAPLLNSTLRPRTAAPAVRINSAILYHATRPVSKEPNVLKETIDHHPETTTIDSTVRPVFDKPAKDSAHGEEDMMAGIKQDMVVIKETFALHSVPRESYYLGAAGVIPFATISLSTVYLAFDVNHAAQHGEGFLFSPEMATQLLGIITPIQIGFGAVIISFLGAIHWGLEYAKYGGTQGYKRYMYGVLAPAIAWPTILMPVETALITQFLAFVFQYFADARATVAGWCPPWYSSYRFVLTFFVGASIVLTLIGRGQIARHDVDALKSPVQSIMKDRDMQWEALEREERERQRKIAEEEEAEGDEEDEAEVEEDDKTEEE